MAMMAINTEIVLFFISYGMVIFMVLNHKEYILNTANNGNISI